MFYDGHLYAAFGKNAAEKGFWLVPHLAENAYSRFDQHPPFIFILEGLFFKIFGVNQVAARVFISLFSLGTLSVLYKSVKRLIGEKEAFISSFLFLLIPALLKKSRFPNMDVPLMLFSFITLLNYYLGVVSEKKSLFHWTLCGIFFGLSLLTKGAMGAIIPAAIGFHILFTKNWKVLLEKGFWLAFLMGLLIFSLWPLSLYLSGNYEIFEGYLGYVFGLSKGEAATDFHAPFYTHLLFYSKQVPHLWFPFLVSIVPAFKEKRPFHQFIVSSFVGMVFLLSLSSVKVSNYLLPTYPFLAIGACYGLMPLFEKEGPFSKFKKFMILVAVATPLVLLIFPLTNKSSRDKPLFKTKKVLETLHITPKEWVIVDDSYPYWNVANWAAWKGAGLVRQIKRDQILDKGYLDRVFIMPASYSFERLGLKGMVLFRDPKNIIVLISGKESDD